MTAMLGRIELCLWVLAMALLGLLSIHRVGARVYNDSYLYLSVAENLRTRGQIATSIVHFDAERASGRLPAPETTFPPGYSAALNLLLWTHLSPEKSALMISMLSMVSIVPLVWWATGLLGATSGLRRAAVAAWALNSQAIAYATTITSEGLFTALVIAGVVLLIFSECSNQIAARSAVPAAMVLIGLSYWVRYAGLLVVAALIVYTGWLIFRRDSRLVLWLSSLLICLGPVTWGIVRNLRIAGTWRGGNDLVVHKSLFSVLRLFKGVCFHLLFGDARAKLSLGIALFVSSVLAIFVILFKSSNIMGNRILRSSTTLLLFALVAGYCAGMIYLGTHTMISFSTRMFVPIYPEFILLCSAVLAGFWPSTPELRIHRAIPLLALVAICGYGFENIFSLVDFSYVPPHVTLAALFAEPTPDGTSVRIWLDKKLPTDAPVLAAEGQATAYLLHRPAISIVARAFSSRNWDEKEVRQTMSTYHVEYLVLYPGLSTLSAPEQEESQFLHSLIEGEHPSWLEPVVRTPHVAIFKLHPTIRDSSVSWPETN